MTAASRYAMYRPKPQGPRHQFKGDFHPELSALHPSDYKFSQAKFRRQTLMNAGLGVAGGFFLATALVPLFPKVVAPLAAPLCNGVVSVGGADTSFTIGAFHQESRVLCTSASGWAEVFTIPTALMTTLVGAVVCFALLMLISSMTKKFHNPIYR